MTDGVTVHNSIAYANHDGVELQGDFYLPKDAKAALALVAVHGGGWIAGVRGAFQWGPFLAARGIAVLAISYRLATKTKTFPEAVQDVLAAVQFVRGKASAFGLDPARIGLLGASAGAHLAALAALSGKKFLGATYANNGIGVLLATGTEDDFVDPKTQTEPFQLALKQAGFFVRPCIVPGAPHYWMNDPIEEPGSLSGFLAPRLVRFLAERL